MKRFMFALLCLTILSATPSVFAGETVKPKEKEKEMKNPADEDGPVNLTGMMAIKATDAKKGVVARFEGKKRGHWYNLIASDEVATKIEKLRQEGDKVKISGKRVGDDITVESIASVKNMQK